MCRVSARRLSIYNFTWEGHEKSTFSTSKVKKPKYSYGIYPKYFAGSTQNHKKIIETRNQPIETKTLSKKVGLVSQK
jgi:hypothetical protein